MRPRLLWVTQHYPPARGGMSTSCDRIVRGLRENGVIVDVAHLSGRHSEVDVSPKMGGDLLRIPIGVDPAHAMQRLWLRLSSRNIRYTHVVAFGGPLPLRAAPVYASWLGVPLYVLLRGNDLDVGIFSPRDRDALERALRASHEVGVVATDHERKINTLYPEVNTTFLPNGVEMDSFTPLAHDRSRAAAYRNERVPPGRQVLGLVGHLKLKKGAVCFLNALLSSGCVSEFHLRFVGEIHETLARVLEDASCGSQLSFTVEPFRDRWDLLEVYASLDWIVLPSFYDGMPNVMLEAMATGIPALCSAVGGMADAVTHERSGILFSADDMPSAREALIRVAQTSRDQRQRFGEAARAVIQQRFLAGMETERYLNWFGLGQRQTQSISSRTHPTHANTFPPSGVSGSG